MTRVTPGVHFGARPVPRFVPRRTFIYTTPLFYGNYYPYMGYSYYSPFYPTYDTFSYGPSMSYNASDGYATDQQLGNELNNLSTEVGRLQGENEALRSGLMQQQNAAPSTPVTGPAASIIPATVLVFRDGHQMEIHNYAIADSTLWVLYEQAMRIPLSDLDLNATVKANSSRGVTFAVPSSPPRPPK